jgi:hypothetical protein
VTIVLKPELEGWLDEDKLRPIFTKIFETSQYTVAFSSDQDSQEIIGASHKEDEAIVDAQDEEEFDPADEVVFTNGSHHPVESKFEFVIVTLLYLLP